MDTQHGAVKDTQHEAATNTQHEAVDTRHEAVPDPTLLHPVPILIQGPESFLPHPAERLEQHEAATDTQHESVHDTQHGTVDTQHDAATDTRHKAVHDTQHGAVDTQHEAATDTRHEAVPDPTLLHPVPILIQGPESFLPHPAERLEQHEAATDTQHESVHDTQHGAVDTPHEAATNALHGDANTQHEAIIDMQQQAGSSTQQGPSKSIGPYSAAAGIDQTTLQEDPLPTVGEMKNGVIVELYMYITKTLKLSQRVVASKVISFSGCNMVKVQNVSALIAKLINAYRKMIKDLKGDRKIREVKQLLDKEFLLIRSRGKKTPDTPRKQRLRQTISTLVKESKGMKRKLSLQEASLLEEETTMIEKDALAERLVEEVSERKAAESENLALHTQLKELEGNQQSLLKDLQAITEKFDPTKDELAKYKQKFADTKKLLEATEEKMVKVQSRVKHSEHRNLHKKLKRRDESLKRSQSEAKRAQEVITELKEEIKTTTAQLEVSRNSLMDLEAKCETLKVNKRKDYKKLWTLKKNTGKYAVEQTNQLDIGTLEERIHYLKQKNMELQQLINLMEDDNIQTFADGKFNDSVRLTIMELSACNVSLSMIDKVIRAVLKNLARKEVDRLPSMGTKSRILLEARHLADVEVASAMNASRPGEAIGNCIHGDGTTKHHKKYQNFQVTLPDGTSRTMGLTEMAGGDTTAVFNAFELRVQELAESLSVADPDKAANLSKDIMTTIKSTMTDQGPTMPQFSEKLKVLKEELLPEVVSNWDILQEEDKATCRQFATFYCKMHPLINFAEEVDKVLKSYEDIASEGKTTHTLQTGESGVRRLIRTASKAYHHRGSDKSGVEDSFTSYLSHEFDTTNHLVDYVGNRANILFEGAAVTFFHLQHFRSFVSILPDPNNLLHAVAEDASDKVYEAELRALGIVHKIITEPFWTAVKTADNILGLNDVLYQVHVKLTAWKNAGADMLSGVSAVTGISPVMDIIYDKLFEDEEDADKHAICVQALELICCAILQILERQCKDQLPGGKYWKPAAAFEQSFSNVPSTNLIGERDFAILDMLVRQKPSARVISLEALIMWINNKTARWIHSLDETRKTELMTEARTRAPAVLQKYKDRMTAIKSEKWRLLQEKQKKKEEKTRKQVTERVALIETVISQGGIWKTKDRIEEEFEKMKDEDEETVRRAIYNQLHFHQKVLQLKGPRELFQLTTTVDGKRKVFDREEMKTHLLTIVEGNSIPSSDPNILVTTAKENESTTSSRTFSHPDERNPKFLMLKEKLYNKMGTEKKKRDIKSSREQLETLIQNPLLLVGKKIKHKCWNEEKTEAEWYDGVVKSIEREDENPVKTEYTVEYDGHDDDEEYWVFDLLQDLKKNDLIICDL